MTVLTNTTADEFFFHPKLWELWPIPYYGKCRIYVINRRSSLQVYLRKDAAPAPSTETVASQENAKEEAAEPLGGGALAQ